MAGVLPSRRPTPNRAAAASHPRPLGRQAVREPHAASIDVWTSMRQDDEQARRRADVALSRVDAEFLADADDVGVIR